jgi:polar amino acid transport system substrate-binding protein
MERQNLFLALLVCGLIFLAAGCAKSDRAARPGESTLDRMVRTGAVKIGYANEAPYAYMDRETGRLTGEAPEIAREILGKMGVEQVEGVLTEFGSLIPALQAKKIDVIAAGMYITAPRCKEIAFSNPTYGIGEAFIVKSGNPRGLHSYEDVANNPEALLGVVAGTVERGYARDIGVPDDQITVFPDPPSALAGVLAGRVDAFAGTSLTVQDLLMKAESDELEQADPFEDPVIDGETIRGCGAFGFRKSDTQLLEAFNKELANFLGTPEHLEIVRPFGFTEEQLPGEVTARELCLGSNERS